MLIKRYESGVLSSFLRGTCGGALTNVLGRSGSTNSAITPEQASQLTLEQVQQIADHAEQHNLGIVEHMSDLYALHLGLSKLGRGI